MKIYYLFLPFKIESSGVLNLEHLGSIIGLPTQRYYKTKEMGQNSCLTNDENMPEIYMIGVLEEENQSNGQNTKPCNFFKDA